MCKRWQPLQFLSSGFPDKLQKQEPFFSVGNKYFFKFPEKQKLWKCCICLVKLILLPSAHEPGPSCGVPSRICGSELQLYSRQPEASGWIYRASRSPSLSSMLFRCQLYGRLLEILAQLLSPELWPPGSPNLLAPHWIICTETLIQSQGLWDTLSKAKLPRTYCVEFLKSFAPGSACQTFTLASSKFSAPSCLHTSKIYFVYLSFSKWHWCGIVHLLTQCSADSGLPCWSFCQMGPIKVIVALWQKHELSNSHFFIFFCSRWKMTFLLAILTQCCCLDIVSRNLSSPRAQCHLSV